MSGFERIYGYLCHDRYVGPPLLNKEINEKVEGDWNAIHESVVLAARKEFRKDHQNHHAIRAHC